MTEPTLVQRLFARARSLARGLLHRSEVEAEIEEEFRTHIDMRTDDLIRSGLAPREAARRARLEFGHVESHRDNARASRGLRFFDEVRFSMIDVKLGLRMLIKAPGLTLVSVFALAIGIPVGLAPLHLARAVEAPIPEDAANRVRGLRLWDPLTASNSTPYLEDFELWAENLTSFERLGAFRSSSFALASMNGPASGVRGAVTTASTFEILGTPALHGRTLIRDDEIPGAANVAVLGYDVWRARFAADPDIVGQTVRVGSVTHTVVGVMPPGFLFPGRDQLWLPLQRRVDGADPLGAAGVLVFGRLAVGVSADEAQAEIAVASRTQAALLSETRARLQAEVVPFGFLRIGLPRGGLRSMPEFYFFQLIALLLLLVACGNVGMLVLARTATRFRELAVRTALGASRTRLVSQMFVEALLLAVFGAGVGVFGIDWLLGRVDLAALVGEGALPYWLSLRVQPLTFVAALALAAVSATVAGVVPTLRITGKRIQESIRRAEAGRSGIRFGGLTGALIVADVAVAVIVVGVVMSMSDQMDRVRASSDLVGIPAEEYLAVTLSIPTNDLASADPSETRERTARLATTQQAIVDGLLAEPGVRAVGVADVLPRMDHRSRPVEIEGTEEGGGRTRPWVRTAEIDVDYLAALEQPILAGRDFDRADLEPGVHVALVNTVFAENLLGGGDPLGRRIRFVTSSGTSEWREIVGVVGHLGANIVSPRGDEAVYLPAAPGTIHPMRLAVHVGPTPATLTGRVREIVTAAAPEAVVSQPVVLAGVTQGDWYLMIAVVAGMALVVGILVVLASSSIYAIVSFSVAERTREIGIRTALGAPRGRLVVTILKRSLVQIGVGALIGLPISAWLVFEVAGSAGTLSAAWAVASAVGMALAVVVSVGLLSCVVPMRRALGIEASHALRTDA